ncbi:MULTISPECIES: AlbA family DNA-binding domain-containing protein [Priestia]|uniref:AlbA family DNA-binding domain-containing protein n=1 Tax=Priestia TaxID=2800373 RepID=UPI0007882303|nr:MULTISPECIES: ATP-binding protein [Priestia]SCC14490.1 Putative DNA-binding domain-containing protein [Priestia flexa]
MSDSFYSPFINKEGRKLTIAEICFSDVEVMVAKQLEEGYQLEFKREVSSTVKRKIPNIIASFANEMGGWLIFGVDEDDYSINLLEKKEYELFIHNMLKDVTNPIPRIFTRFLSPEHTTEYGVFVIWIPEGLYPPYMSYGKVYRRIGSGTSPISEIDDRYHLDRLYQKSKDRMMRLEAFCTKELSIYNRKGLTHGEGYVHYGMCNMYVIPIYDLYLLEHMDEDKLKQYILSKSNEPKAYPMYEEIEMNVHLPFVKASYSAESIIFRNTDVIDSYDKTVAWEQFVNGAAKFHIPIPYVEELDEVKSVLQECVPSYRNAAIFDQFQYVDGHQFLTLLLSCLGEYIECMTQLNAELEDMIVVIDLENVRNDVLYFNHEAYKGFLREEGLVFSDKKHYRFNKSFRAMKLKEKNGESLFQYVDYIINAFGLSKNKALHFLMQSFYQSK